MERAKRDAEKAKKVINPDEVIAKYRQNLRAQETVQAVERAVGGARTPTTAIEETAQSAAAQLDKLESKIRDFEKERDAPSKISAPKVHFFSSNFIFMSHES